MFVVVWMFARTHIKPPQALGLQEASPELGDDAGRFGLDHGFPGAELLVLQPLSAELCELRDAELLVRRVPRHGFLLWTFNLNTTTMTPWRTLPFRV